jgi:hypothetical protein
VRVSSVLPVAVLGALALAAGPLRAQGYRVELDARLQGVNYRGWQLDSIPVAEVVTGSDGLAYTAGGIGVTCLPGRAYCLYYGPGDKIAAMPFVATADFAVWNLGLKGLRFEGTGRFATDFKDGPAANLVSGETPSAWPGAQPQAQLLEAYFAYAGGWYGLRGGRLTNVSRFGYTGYDGGELAFKALGGRAGLSAYGGWALARGALVPANSPLLNPLADYGRPATREILVGADVNWNLPWVSGRLLYQREFESDSGADLVSSELMGGDLALRPHRMVTVSGGLEYDFAYGNIGNAEGQLTTLLPKQYGSITLGGRRYRPRFPLWAIWTAFSPVPYSAWFGQASANVMQKIQLRGRVERFAYDESEAATNLVVVEDNGWRYGLGATYRHTADLHATLDYQAGFGPGAQAVTIDGGVFWRPRPKLGLNVGAAYVDRTLELRYSGAKLFQAGLDADVLLLPQLRAFGGAWYVDEKRERPDAAGFDWNQVRFNLGLRYGFGTSVDRPSLPPAILRIPEGGAK